MSSLSSIQPATTPSIAAHEQAVQKIEAPQWQKQILEILQKVGELLKTALVWIQNTLESIFWPFRDIVPLLPVITEPVVIPSEPPLPALSSDLDEPAIDPVPSEPLAPIVPSEPLPILSEPLVPSEPAVVAVSEPVLPPPPIIEQVKKPALPRPPLLDPTLFLKKDDAAFNLERLSQIGYKEAVRAVATEEIYNLRPKQNAFHLGYETITDYQTQRADKMIAAELAAACFSIFAITAVKLIGCISVLNTKKAASDCYANVGNWWTDSGTAKAILIGEGLLIAASLYAHRQGWLGKWLHDSSQSKREQKIETLYREIGNELLTQANQARADKNEDQLAALKQKAAHILEHRKFIQTTLQCELQLPKEKAKELMGILKSACREDFDQELEMIDANMLVLPAEGKMT